MMSQTLPPIQASSGYNRRADLVLGSRMQATRQDGMLSAIEVA